MDHVLFSTWQQINLWKRTFIIIQWSGSWRDQLVQKTSWLFTSPSVPFKVLLAILGAWLVVGTNCCFLSGSPYRSWARLFRLLVAWTQLLQSECLCPQIHMLNPNPKDDGTGGDWGLWEALRSWRWSLTNEISAFLKRSWLCWVFVAVWAFL